MENDKKTMLISGVIGIGIGLFISGIILIILLYNVNSREMASVTNSEQIKKNDFKEEPEKTESQKPNTNIKTENIEAEIKNIGSKEKNTQPEVENIESEIQNIQPKVENVQPKVENTQPKVENIQPKVENIQPKVENVEPKVENSQLAAKNIKSEVENIEPETVEIEIQRRATAKQISDLLEKKGVISDADDFRSYIKSKNATRILVQGRKTFKINSDYETALEVLMSR